MGNPNGFLRCNRKENGNFEPLERIKNFNEFHPLLDEKARREQASRCMNCGVPMCQSAIRLAGMVTGCPLHNYIPEWNDALFQGQFDMAAWRLLKTSSFPEFTGRVCPALCEKACNCGNISNANGEVSDVEPVTIHDNELFIIERAFESGYMKPEVPEVRSSKKIAVIGAGPSGLACADWLNRRGHNVTVFEREDAAGGLLMYGIPNMKLNKKIIDRRINLMKAEGINFVFNTDIGKNYDSAKITNEFDAVALCCGAKKARQLTAFGMDKITMGTQSGVMFAVDFLTKVTKSVVKNQQNKDATIEEISKTLNDDFCLNVQDKNVIVLGGGDTGNDCTGTSIRLGCKSVTQLEMMPCPPTTRAANNPWPQWPKVLKTDYGAEESIAKFGHDPRVFETTIKEVISQYGKINAVKTVEVEFKMIDGKRQLVEREGSEKILPCDILLIAAGFLGAEEYTALSFDVNLSPRNTVATENPEKYQTSKEKIFTCGDMHRGQSLVVWAIAEGRDCAKSIDEFLMGYTNL